jgi:decaprenyl-phosphate phosphoribosyltransferase
MGYVRNAEEDEEETFVGENLIAPEEMPAASDAHQKTPGGATRMLSGLVRLSRPKQWMKNFLVFVAPLFSGVADHIDLLNTTLALVVFSIAASGIYFTNDARDVSQDRAHPTKRHRPIAAGTVPLPVAYTASAVLLAGSVVMSLLANPQLALIVTVYVVVQLSYCFGLKHKPVIEMCIVASGFLLRAVAGGAAAHISISPWLLLVTTFGSLFMTAGKRYSELLRSQQTGATIRKSLNHYSMLYLRFVWTACGGAAIITYLLWTFDDQAVVSPTWAHLSAAPFIIAILRYSIDINKGNAEAPEEVILRDRILLLLGVILATCLFFAPHHIY